MNLPRRLQVKKENICLFVRNNKKIGNSLNTDCAQISLSAQKNLSCPKFFGGRAAVPPTASPPVRLCPETVVLWWSPRELRSSDWSLGVGSWKIASRLSLDSCYNCSANVFPRFSLLVILSSIFSSFFITDPASHLAHCMLHRSTRRATRIQLYTLLKAVQGIEATEYKALNVTAVLVAKV